MRHIISFVALCAALWVPAVSARAEQKVVVELYTSQGCSSCPPADAMLGELAARPDVIALALHVDYWDYIGWADIFASPDYTRRQKAYAHAAGERMVYTPQMVIGGQDHVVGTRPMEVLDLIEAHRAQPSPVTIALDETGDRLRIAVEAARALEVPCVVQLVRFQPEATVEIKRGENAGRTLDYVNIVTSWEVIAEWDGRMPFEAMVPRGDLPVVIIVQRLGHGPILAAAELR